MSIEKPISTIRKAVQGSAEKVAAKEFLDEPEQRHYDKIFNVYRFLRQFEPEKIERIIKIAAKEKELKDEMGIELYKVFNQVWEQLIQGYENKIDEAVKQITATKRLSPQELSKEVLNLNER